jgi:hypothetical protein
MALYTVLESNLIGPRVVNFLDKCYATREEVETAKAEMLEEERKTYGDKVAVYYTTEAVFTTLTRDLLSAFLILNDFQKVRKQINPDAVVLSHNALPPIMLVSLHRLYMSRLVLSESLYSEHPSVKLASELGLKDLTGWINSVFILCAKSDNPKTWETIIKNKEGELKAIQTEIEESFKAIPGADSDQVEDIENG